MKITTLCFGNINRSPAAKVALERAIADKKITNIVVDSCGTSDYNQGKKAAKKMRDEMARRGYDLSTHEAKQITIDLVNESDIIVYMDGGNYRKITKMFGPEILQNKLVQLSKFMPFDDIEDPHFAKAELVQEIYHKVVDQIVTASEALIEQIANGVDVRGQDSRNNNDIFGW